jgi:hypothetical protein
MNPLNIVASSMSVCQAVERLGGLLAVLEDLAHAPEDIASLKHGISSMKVVLEGVQSVASTGGQFESLRLSVAASLVTLARLETMVQGSHIEKTKNNRRSDERARVALNSLVWVRKKRRLVAVQQQLRDGIVAVQLEVSSLSL